MKNFRKIIILGGVILALGVTSFTALAARDHKTPAETLAGLTGKTVDSVIDEREETNKSYATIASEAGKLEEFKKENLEIKKDKLKIQVSEGKITQEKADRIINEIEERQANCDGACSEKIGENRGAGFGHNGPAGHGKQRGQARQGRMRLHDGTCNTQAK